MNNLRKLKKTVIAVKAIAHPLRQRIIDLIKTKEKDVTHLYVPLRESQATISQHLAILRRAGIVKTRREGKHIFYSLEHEKYSEILKLSKVLNP